MKAMSISIFFFVRLFETHWVELWTNKKQYKYRWHLHAYHSFTDINFHTIHLTTLQTVWIDEYNENGNQKEWWRVEEEKDEQKKTLYGINDIVLLYSKIYLLFQFCFFSPVFRRLIIFFLFLFFARTSLIIIYNTRFTDLICFFFLF